MASIVEEIRNNREKGAKLLESEYKAGLMSLARRFCNDESDAEELVNRTFAIVVEKIDSYLEQSAFFGWMSRILINCYSKDVRRKSNEMEFCDAQLPEDAQDDEASARVFREVDASILRDAIDRLPKDMKQTLLLHYFMDMPVREVAKVLSVPSGTIMWRLHYARKILGAKLGASLKKPIASLFAAVMFMMASAAAVVAVVTVAGGGLFRTEPVNQDDASAASATEETEWTEGGEDVASIPSVASNQTSTQKEKSTMQTTSVRGLFRKTLRRLATIATAAAAAVAPAVASTAEWSGEGANALNSASYVKVMEKSGPLAGTWSLVGITAWNGAEQVAFTVVSNRPYAAANSATAQGAMPAGNYVHQLSVFNQWDGSRTRSYRVQLAQPVGGNDIYARVTAVTVSQEGVNLVDYPDLRDLKDDNSKIAASYTDAADLANFPVTKLKFKHCDGYLESEGDAFISLGHCAGPNTRIEVDMQLTEITLGKIPFGSYGDHVNDPLFELFISYSSVSDQRLKYSWEFSDASGVRQSMNCDLADNDRHVIAFDAPTMTYTSRKNGEFVSTYTFDRQLLAKTSSVPMSVFGRGVRKYASAASADFGGATKMKVYGVRIFESGVLVKNFMPCVRGGVPGLIDTCNNAFVTGVDVSKVKHGGGVPVVKDDPYIVLDNTINTRENGKSHYLELFYSFKPSTRIELDYALLAQGFTASPFLFDAYGSSKMDVWTYNGHYAFTIANVDRYTSGNGVGDIENMSVATAYAIRRTVAMNSNSVCFVTAGFTNVLQTASPALTSTSNTKILIGNRGSDLGRYIPMRIYGLRLYENDVPEKNYVPIVTNGVPGMIDLIGGSVLYPMTDNGSAQRSLVVEAGGNFPCTDGSDEAYLEFPGTGSGIDTLYKVTPNSCIEADFSIWNTYKVADGNEKFVNQSSGTYVLLDAVGSSYNSIWWQYYDYGSGGASSYDSGVSIANERRQYILDSHGGKLTIKRGDSVLKDITMSTTRTRTDGSSSDRLLIGKSNAHMRLYGFKIWEYVNNVKTPMRDFVPCVTNGVAGLYDFCESKFYPLSGGKVSGATPKGQDEFLVEPQSTKITRHDVSKELTCFSAAAKSYEWYVDGEKIDGETGESLTVNWTKTIPHVRTYSVVPVYKVFGEETRGKATEATVEFVPIATALIIR